MKYAEELRKAMITLSQDPRVIFLGQAVRFKGTAMTDTLQDVPPLLRIEMPVCEEMQMGMATGMALTGLVPVCLFTRENFFLLAMNQLVNHLDKLSQMSNGGYQPKVIIRTSIGAEKQLTYGPQHSGDFTTAIKSMLTNIEVIKLDWPGEIEVAYHKALHREDGKSTIIVEWGDYYDSK
jgi:pyruvate/2-oxoglutarate/acetoin dehydrogenase E1 component